MVAYKDVELLALPSLTKGYIKAAGRLVWKSLTAQHGARQGSTLPQKRLVLKNYLLQPEQVEVYRAVTQLPQGEWLPLTYLYSLAFPMMIKLLTEQDFPYSPVGLVHLHNQIDRYRTLKLDALVDLYVYSTNLREHRAGMLFDVITEVYMGSDLVWSQVSTMLHKQKTSLKKTHKEARPAFDKSVQYRQQTIEVTPDLIRAYARISGDRNPIHMSALMAKAFGFPRMIAHGSWMMARILSCSENELPEACRYQINFGKPFLVPGRAELFSFPAEDGTWSYSLERTEQEKIILDAQILPL
ncbi:MAG: MaoC family dehydratase [Neisseriaceae bacterium]